MDITITDNNEPQCTLYEIAKRFRVLRRTAGDSQSDVAKALQISHQQVQKYEKALNRIPATAIYNMSLRWRAPISEFFPLSDEEINTDLLDREIWLLAQKYKTIKSKTTRKKILSLIDSIGKDEDIVLREAGNDM